MASSVKSHAYLLRTWITLGIRITSKGVDRNREPRSSIGATPNTDGISLTSLLSRRSLLCASLATMATPALAAPEKKARSYTAMHGHALFSTEHLLPGDGIELSRVDRTINTARIIALTIDDGPVPEDLPLLDTLKQLGVKATFFQVGRNIHRNPEIAKTIIQAGHEVGNHTFAHPMMTDISAAEQLRNLNGANHLLADFGVQPAWFRPPYGDFDSSVVAEARSLGMRTVLWTHDTQDWKGVDADTIARREIAGLMPGTIVLMHSTRTASHTALTTFVPEALRQGYRFVTISEWYQTMQDNVTATLAARVPVPGTPPR